MDHTKDHSLFGLGLPGYLVWKVKFKLFYFRVHWLSKNPPKKRFGSSHLVSDDRITPHVLSHEVRPFGRRTTLLSGLTNHGY